MGAIMTIGVSVANAILLATFAEQRRRAGGQPDAAAIAATTERSFVIRVRDGVTEWVDVKRGASMNYNGADLIEVFGDIAPGDQIAARGTDELRAGTKVNVKQQGGK